MLTQKLRNEAEDSLSFLRSHTSAILELETCEMKAQGFILSIKKQYNIRERIITKHERENVHIQREKVYSSNIKKTQLLLLNQTTK